MFSLPVDDTPADDSLEKEVVFPLERGKGLLEVLPLQRRPLLVLLEVRQHIRRIELG